MERIKQTACGMVAMLFALAGAAQNNAIFKGGTNDGWTAKNSLQANSNIYKGGTSDGWSSSNYLQSSTSIFKGGNGDGWASLNTAQTSASIFKGGVGDGWDSKNYVQASTGIFNGGFGDGWDAKNYLQLSTGIFKGGAGDGWASTYRPLGVLPVTFIRFTAQKQSEHSSLLQWQTGTEINTAFFDVERSSDAVHFVKVGRVAAAGNSVAPTLYSHVDAQPWGGYNYYRLKQVDQNGDFIYTPTRLLVFDASTLQTLKAYPVPTLGTLTVELPAQINSEESIINVSNAIGVMVQQIKLAKDRPDNKRILNLHGLPAGVYTVQVCSQSFNGAVTIIKQ